MTTEPFTTIDPCDIQDNVFKLIGSDWMLVTSGTVNSFNTMTASWGAFGELWNRKICICFIRPSRYTYQFTEKHDIFTLSFFDEAYRDVLQLCGTKSGRDVDKVKESGLTPAASPAGSVFFEEARLVMECRTMYTHDLDRSAFRDPEIEKHYPKQDYHRMYVGHVLSCLWK
jgi:flavin reductase (DIM6/NTAB) family NADH-FMN oxidoreductase RutF